MPEAAKRPVANVAGARLIDDVKSALTLSGMFGVAAAITVPLLLPSLPEEARVLPMPVWAFCLLLAPQMALVYGFFGVVGCRLARASGIEPAPLLADIWARQRSDGAQNRLLPAIFIGLACGVFLVAVVAVIKRLLPDTLPQMLHPVGVVAALAASTAGSLGEEILFRLLALSAFVKLLPKRASGVILAVGLTAIIYGIAHAPAAVFLYGGLQNVPLLSWVWMILLNGVVGVCFGVIYLRRGVEAAVIAHLATDAVWHAASQLFGA